MSILENQLSVLRTEIEGWEQLIKERRLYYRNKSFGYYLIISVSSAITTVLLGLKIDRFADQIRITALIFSATVTVFSAISVFFNYKELWIANDTSLFKVGRLKFDIDISEAHNATGQEEIDTFKRRLDEILDDLNITWQKNRQTRP